MAEAGPHRDKTGRGIAAGSIAGALFALGLYLAALRLHPDSGLVLISVMLIPTAACALAVIVAGVRGPGSGGRAFSLSAWVVTILLVFAAVLLREGAICIAMAAPIFYPLGILGGLLATVFGRPDGKSGSASLVVLLPVVLLPIEEPAIYPTARHVVTTQIEIAAPLETVWREAIEIRDVAESEQQRTFTHDLLRVPRPTDARLVQRGDQLVRAATWRGDVRFYEVITEWRQSQTVAWQFEIPEAAADRLLDHHLRLDEQYLRLDGGRYTLEAIAPERTRLTLSTTYSTRTPFNAYAEAWGDLFLGDIHRNVLGIVRMRSEAQRSTRNDGTARD